MPSLPKIMMVFQSGHILERRACVRYEQQWAYFSKFRAIQDETPLNGIKIQSFCSKKIPKKEKSKMGISFGHLTQ